MSNRILQPANPFEEIVPVRFWPYVPLCGSHPIDEEWWQRFHEKRKERSND